jgi:hypothetical protein
VSIQLRITAFVGFFIQIKKMHGPEWKKKKKSSTYFTTGTVGDFIAFLLFSARPLEGAIIREVLRLATRN